MYAHQDISNQRFGRLVALRYTKRGIWECVCDCGATTSVPLFNLKAGNTSSCGCLRKETKRGKSEPKTHCKNGHELTPETTYLLKSGYVACKICEKERVYSRRAKK